MKMAVKRIILEIKEDGSIEEAERILCRLKGIKNRFIPAIALTFADIDAEKERLLEAMEEEMKLVKEDIEFRYPVNVNINVEFRAPDGSWGVDLTQDEE